jgi:hypothetical protein
MECGSEFRELANHNQFIQGLEDQGYHVDFVAGYFVIFGLPYLDKEGALRYGDWVSPVDLTEWVLDAPSDHQAWFRGERPCDRNGRQLRLGGGASQITIAEGFTTDHSFSFKLLESGQMRGYQSFQEKVVTYLEAITGPAMAAYPEATPLRAIELKAAAQGSPLRYPDTLSSRYNINDLSSLLRGKKIAIIGLGGTGSYILDRWEVAAIEQRHPIIICADVHAPLVGADGCSDVLHGRGLARRRQVKVAGMFAITVHVRGTHFPPSWSENG